MIGWNLWLNIAANDWWAEGNVFLVYNTVYLLIQCFLSMWLAFEIPTWLKHMKAIRFLSMVAANVYNIVFFLSILKWVSMIWWEDNSNANIMTLLVNMNIGYNLIVHWSIIPINLAIVSKEISMEFIQMASNKAGEGDKDDISLGMVEAAQFWAEVLAFFNPLNWIDIWFTPIAGESIEQETVDVVDKIEGKR